MATKKKSTVDVTPVGKPQSAYNKDRPGDYWFTEEQNVMDNRKTKNTPDDKEYDGSGRARSEQLKDESQRASRGVAGAIPSYKKGGKIRKTGLALVHKGERMIPKGKVKRVEKAMHAMKRG